MVRLHGRSHIVALCIAWVLTGLVISPDCTLSVTTASPASTTRTTSINLESGALPSTAVSAGFSFVTTEVDGVSTTSPWEEIVASDAGLDWFLISDESITTCVDISEITSRILLRYEFEHMFPTVGLHIWTKGQVVFSSMPNIIPTVFLTHKSDLTDQSGSIFQNVPNLCIYNGFSDVGVDVTNHQFMCKCNGGMCDQLFMWIWPESVVAVGMICDARISQ